jgi:N-methylhydantoinase B
VAPGVVFSIRSDGHELAPPGLAGGGDGRPARLLLNPGRPDQRQLGGKVSRIELSPGQSIRLETAGGAGFGDPALRAPERLAADLADAKVKATR